MKSLYLIPARGGSKGLPGKNILPLNNKPLIHYSIDFARQFAPDRDICVSTDDKGIVESIKQCNLNVPFIRPSHLATDISSTYDVILHALRFYANKGIKYERLILLQPTSPLRKAHHLTQMLALYSSEIDMVVSVNIAKHNPYYTLFEENTEGYLTKSKEANFTRRQDIPQVYALNGSIYVMNVSSLLRNSPSKFIKVKKHLVEEVYGADIDSFLDFKWVEFLMQNDLFNHG